MIRRRIYILDCFRGIAIIGIVCFHLLSDVATQYGTIFNNLIQHANYGVQIFFVISGVSISYYIQKLNQSQNSPIILLKRYILRIYIPHFYALLFSGIIIPFLIYAYLEIKGVDSKHIFFTYSMADWIHLFTLTKVFIPYNSTFISWRDIWQPFMPINPPLWYIAVMVQIYIIIFIALLFKAHYLKVIGIITGLSVISLIHLQYVYFPYGLFLPFWLHFVWGMLLFYLTNHGYVHTLKFIITAGLSLLMGGIIFLFTIRISSFLTYSPLIFSLLFGILFWLLYPHDQTLSHLFFLKPFKFIGKFSYSIYLLHFPLRTLVEVVVKDIVSWPRFIYMPVLVIPLILIISYLWYQIFERKWTNLTPKIIYE